MPFTPAQLVTGANYSLATWQRKDPIDQVNFQHATLKWLLERKEVSTFGNGSFKEPIYVTNNSNAQNYFGADQVTYNERDPVKWTDFTWYNMHDGFWFDEDRLLAAGITVKDDSDAIPTSSEKETLIDLLKVSYNSLKMSMMEALAYETLRDGSQSNKAVPGLSFLVDATPATGVVGGIDAATNPYWQNNASIGIANTPGLLLTEMERMWMACMLYGGMTPTFIPCGSAFLARYKLEAGLTINRQINDMGNVKGGVSLDASVNDAFFHGIPLVWDPTFDKLDTLLGTTTWTKTALFLNDQAIKFRPVKNNWMVDRKPERLPDRYVHYFAKTSKYGLTVNRRNATAILTIA